MVGDIGGTKTTIAIFAVESGPRQILIQQTYPSKDYPSLDAIVMAFIADKLGVDQALSGAVFGVAGPVLGTRAQVTNLPWLIDAGTLSQAMHCPVKLLNDLEAIASAVPYLTADDLETLNVGSPVAEATIAVIAPGTGLGEAYLTWDGTGYRAHPSEGGHADFAPTTTLELALLTALQPKFGHVSYERVCSGSGVPNLYDFLRDSGRAPEPDWLTAALSQAVDRTPIIMQAAESSTRTAPIAQQTLDLFITILAGEASNLALKMLATGGIYLGGGIPPRILPQLKAPGFMTSFMNKGRFADLLSHVPVHVITNPQIALLGGSHYYQRMIALK